MKSSTVLLFLVLVWLSVCHAQTDLSINPPTSEVGTSIVISSKSQFDSVPVNNQITFTGNAKPVPAEWVSNDKNYLLVRVPSGTTDGPVSIAVKNKPIGSIAFKVKPPAGWPSAMVWIGIFFAVFMRAAVPFWAKKIKEGATEFKKEYLLPPVIGMIVSMPTVFGLLPSIGFTGNAFQDFLAAFSVTYASQDIIREAQKIVS